MVTAIFLALLPDNESLFRLSRRLKYVDSKGDIVDTLYMILPNDSIPEILVWDDAGYYRFF